MRIPKALFAFAALAASVASLEAQEAAFGQTPPAAAYASQNLRPLAPRPKALTIHPAFSLAISGLNLSYEMPMGDGLWSCEIPLYLGYNERLWSNPTFFAGSGFGMRRYLIERGAGTYVSPSLDFVDIRRFEKGPAAGNNTLTLAPNLRMGYRWNWNAFTMDAAMGFVYYESILTRGARSSDDLDARGLLPMFQWSLGIPF